MEMEMEVAEYGVGKPQKRTVLLPEWLDVKILAMLEEGGEFEDAPYTYAVRELLTRVLTESQAEPQKPVTAADVEKIVMGEIGKAMMTISNQHKKEMAAIQRTRTLQIPVAMLALLCACAAVGGMIGALMGAGV